MSFILDALKKSENERQRHVGPSLADIPIRRARTDRPWWAVAVAALLVVNLGILLIVLLRDRGPGDAPVPPAASAAPAQSQPSPPPQRAEPAIATPVPQARPAPRPTPRSSPAVQSLAEVAGAHAEMPEDEEPYYDPSIASAAVVPDGPPVVRSIDPSSAMSRQNSPAFPAQNRTPPQDTEVLPTHGSLIASGRQLPEMRLDIHVFHSDPQQRFVFINMRKYVEGQTLSEGPVVERIRADGVVLNQSGLRYLLPRN